MLVDAAGNVAPGDLRYFRPDKFPTTMHCNRAVAPHCIREIANFAKDANSLSLENRVQRRAITHCYESRKLHYSCVPEAGTNLLPVDRQKKALSRRFKAGTGHGADRLKPVAYPRRSAAVQRCDTASTTHSAVMLTMRRTVADGVRMCTGRAQPSSTGPTAMPWPAAVLSRL